MLHSLVEISHTPSGLSLCISTASVTRKANVIHPARERSDKSCKGQELSGMNID